MKTRTFLLGSSLLVAMALSACNIRFDVPFATRELQGSGTIVTEEIEVSGFDRLSLEGFGSLTVSQGEEESLTITTDDNIMPYLETDVRLDTLVLGFTDDGRDYSMRPTDGIRYDLVVTDLSRIDLSGAWSVDVDDINTEMLTLELTGAGSVKIRDLTADELVVRQSGAGSIIVSGQVKGQDVSMTGAGSYSAADLESETAIVEISGIGTATVWATETLDVDISSVGNVIYYGSPRVISSVSGLGELVSQGDK